MPTAIVALACLLSTPPPQLADRRIPPRPELSLEFPVTADKAIAVLQRASMSAGVPSGIEQAPPGSGPGESSRKTAGLRLSGRKVREVLDEFIELDARYDRREAGGRIILRPRTTRGPKSLLQKRLPAFELRAVTLPEAIIGLSRVAWTSEHSFMTVHFRQGELPLRRTLSVSLRSPTVLDALNAISSAAGCSPSRPSG